MIGKNQRNEQIFQARLTGESTIEIAKRFNVSVSRVRQVYDMQWRIKNTQIVRGQTGDWRSMPVRYAKISSRLCNVLCNENFQTMGEVADDFTSGNFDKRLPIPNFGGVAQNELNTWVLAHILHPSVEQGLHELRKLDCIRLNESLAKTRSKIAALQLIEHRILAKLHSIEST